GGGARGGASPQGGGRRAGGGEDPRFAPPLVGHVGRREALEERLEAVRNVGRGRWRRRLLPLLRWAGRFRLRLRRPAPDGEDPVRVLSHEERAVRAEPEGD